MKKLGLALIALALLSFSLGSCALATGTQNAATAPSASDLKSLQSSYMASYYADRSGSPDGISSIRALTPFSAASSGPVARTTVPVERLTSLAFVGLAPATFSNFPEPGQTTSFTATEIDATNHVYDMKVTTSYPSTDARENYFEEYYVKDGDSDGSWDADTTDYIVSGTPPSGPWSSSAPAARAQMTLSYRDGSVRTEKIYDASTVTGGAKYDFDGLPLSGSLELSQIGAAPSISDDNSEIFSSVVVYKYQPARDSSSFWFWKGKKGAGIIGVRYYTEYADAANQKYIGRSAGFEKIVGSFGTYSLTDATTMGTIVSAVFGSASNVLGSSVVRQEVQFALSGSYPTGSALSSRTRMQTRIMDFVNSWDYILIQDGSDTIRDRKSVV